ncbi:hypothetical protein DM01DRAFT_142909 [Hesseltinella vesiculosa]|uniref:Uncharacterized protein n=1 Tax=Hesseltinella vesiculosa TaxID=101127 RepID=A0A1X2GHP2_9FUNG|nr:hypothetical protein DM01DRAFT_142909 [Hesseltinella vesiculosa]
MIMRVRLFYLVPFGGVHPMKAYRCSLGFFKQSRDLHRRTSLCQHPDFAQFFFIVHRFDLVVCSNQREEFHMMIFVLFCPIEKDVEKNLQAQITLFWIRHSPQTLVFFRIACYLKNTIGTTSTLILTHLLVQWKMIFYCSKMISHGGEYNLQSMQTGRREGKKKKLARDSHQFIAMAVFSKAVGESK